MSGGSHNYLCYKIEEYYVGHMHDRELDDLMKDIAKLTHDLEWYDLGDYGPDGYFDTVKEFKKKWFQGIRKDRLRKLIDESVEELRNELYGMVGECLTQ